MSAVAQLLLRVLKIPGWTLTALVQRQIEKRAAASGRTLNEEKLALVAEKHPSKDFVQVQHLSALALFMCSEAASQMTGK